jgi:hypothetical protein
MHEHIQNRYTIDDPRLTDRYLGGELQVAVRLRTGTGIHQEYLAFFERNTSIRSPHVDRHLKAVARLTVIAAKITGRSAAGPWAFPLVAPLSTKPLRGRQTDLLAMRSVTP